MLSYFITNIIFNVCGGMMRSREELFAVYIIDNKATIRKCAEFFKISKSTVHNDISKKLYKRNKFLYFQVYKILNINYKEKHLRGGLSTKNKYMLLRLMK